MIATGGCDRMYSISEVCDLLDLKPHILRYWEREIPLLSPKKNYTGRRVYSLGDLQILCRLQYLLTIRKFNISSAREKLWQEIQYCQPGIRSTISEIRGELLYVLRQVRQWGKT